MGFWQRLWRGEKRSAPVSDPALAFLLGLGARTATGMDVTPENARECPEVDACISLIEDTIATVPLDLFERTKDGAREKAAAHPLHELLHDRPNGFQTSAEFRLMMEGWRQTHGNAYARIVTRGDGVVSALAPMPPREVRPFLTRKGEIAYDWQPAQGTGGVLLAHEVLHLKDKPFARDMLTGESRVVRHKEAIARAAACGEYISRFFGNDATPKIIIEVPGAKDLTTEQADAIRDMWTQRHSGLANAHKPAILQGGMTVKPVGVTNDEAKIIEAQQAATAQVARVFGVPLHLIFETSKSTSWGTGIEQQSIGFIVYYMRPKFVVWEQALSRALLSASERRRYFFEFNADGLLRGDFKTRMEGFALMIQWGLASPNEIRRLMNMAPVEGGDERMQPLNMAPATRIMDVLLRGASNSTANGGAPGGEEQARAALDLLTRMLTAGVKPNGHLTEGHA